jgi:hypothetical protein
MKTFKYSMIAKIIYRYGNFLISIILFLYLVLSAIGVFKDWRFIFPLVINVILLYVVNRYYLKIYKFFPFRIDADNRELHCSDFMIKDRTERIKIIDIDKIEGGIFSGRNYAPLYIEWNGNRIGISPHMKDFNKLLTIILSNIKKELYEELLESIKKFVKIKPAESNKKKK